VISSSIQLDIYPTLCLSVRFSCVHDTADLFALSCNEVPLQLQMFHTLITIIGSILQTIFIHFYILCSLDIVVELLITEHVINMANNTLQNSMCWQALLQSLFTIGCWIHNTHKFSDTSHTGAVWFSIQDLLQSFNFSSYTE
jgi:hypothetical protein